VLPNLLILGAAKSGTTSLHRYLAQHPEVSMSRRKELAFFTRDDWQARLGWYESRFPAGTAVRGESSPVYTMHPAVHSPAERIHSLLPGVKLVYLVRDPIERLVSHYVEARADGFESRSLGRVLAEDGKRSMYVCASLYSLQIDEYLTYFSTDQLLIIDQSELRIARADTMRSVFSFLGVTPEFTSPRFDRTFNRRQEKIRPNKLGMVAYRRGWAPGVLEPGRPLQPIVRWLLGKPVPSPRLAPDTRAQLVELFKDDVARLREYSRKSFSTWSV